MMNKCTFCGVTGFGGMHYVRPDGSNGFACWKEDCQDSYHAEDDKRKNMEKVSLEIKQGCPFVIAWVGFCEKPGNPYCEEHSKARCHCGSQATHECSDASSLVCGALLCDNCRCLW